MGIRRILVIIFFAVILVGCLGDNEKPMEVSIAEAQATQQAIERRDEFDAKVYEIKLALAWPRMIVWTFLFPVIIVAVVLLVKKLTDQWVLERQILLDERQIETKTQRDLITKPEPKIEEPPAVNSHRAPVDIIGRASPGEYDDIVRIAEKKLK